MARHPDKRQYVVIALLLAAMTAAEVALFYLEATFGSIARPLLVALAALKFVVVVGWYMHVRFENRIIRRFFTSGFVLASTLYAVVLTLGITHADLGTDGSQRVPGEVPLTIEIALVDFDIIPDVVEVPVGADVTFLVSNEGDSQHNFLINGEYGTERLSAGTVESLYYGAVTEPLLAWCTITGHRDLGMEVRLHPETGDE